MNCIYFLILFMNKTLFVRAYYYCGHETCDYNEYCCFYKLSCCNPYYSYVWIGIKDKFLILSNYQSLFLYFCLTKKVIGLLISILLLCLFSCLCWNNTTAHHQNRIQMNQEVFTCNNHRINYDLTLPTYEQATKKVETTV